jgi:rRNA processing protein Krr1/Pno1
MGKLQNVKIEKPVVIKVAHGYNNKKIVPHLFKILRSSTRASALKIKNFIVEATF